MRVLVCGGRHFRDRERLDLAMEHVSKSFGPVTTVIQGEARGADELAVQWALQRGIELLSFPADWERHGRRAGPMRNQQMLDEGRADLVVALPGGSGTRDMVRRARRAGLAVVEK